MGTTKALLHFNGLDNGTAILDSTGNQAWSVSGSACLDMSDKVFGLSSLKMSDTASFVYTNTNTNFVVGANDFTVDVRWKANGWGLYLFEGPGIILTNISNKIRGRFEPTAGTVIWAGNDTTLGTGIWYHIALVRNGTALKVYINGTAEPTIGNCTGATAISPAGTAYIGHFNLGVIHHMDEFRFSTEARWTTNFTPPTSEYKLLIPTPIVFN
jgi:hypothetical protein